ncbi:MAG: hypothetical protein GY909_15380 [Oligoflexia bacterium]|nr:hypothetical protein [Oligoflexia bacterium]
MRKLNLLVLSFVMVVLNSCGPKLSEKTLDKLNKAASSEVEYLLKEGSFKVKIEDIEKLELSLDEVKSVALLKEAGVKDFELEKYSAVAVYNALEKMYVVRDRYFRESELSQFKEETLKNEAYTSKCASYKNGFMGRYCTKHKKVKRKNYAQIEVKIQKEISKAKVINTGETIFKYGAQVHVEKAEGKESTKVKLSKNL